MIKAVNATNIVLRKTGKIMRSRRAPEDNGEFFYDRRKQQSAPCRRRGRSGNP